MAITYLSNWTLTNREVIENGGIQVKPVKNSEKTPFTLSLEERGRYPFGDWLVTVSVITQRLNELAASETMQKLKTTSITKFLLQSELLFEEESVNGSKNKRPTEAGRKLGISTAQRMGQNGEYTAVVYDREAQQFVLDNLDAIIALNAAPLHENQGKPWEPEEDDYLRRAFLAGVGIKELSDELKRTREAIRSRLKKLGLTKE